MTGLPAFAGDFLPHARPMLCIDRLLSASASQAEAESVLVPGHTLLYMGRVQEAGYVEIAAQSAGAMKGYAEKVLGLPVRDGFLAAVQDFSVYELAREGDVLLSSVSLLAEVSGLSLIEARIFRVSRNTTYARESESLVASGKLKVFVPDADSLPSG